jgi:hypothetical protein
MRFVAHIRKKDYPIARASVDNKEGDTPDDLSARAIEALTRDLVRTNHHTYLLDTEGKRDKVNIYNHLVEQYGKFCSDRLDENSDYYRSVYSTRNSEQPFITFQGIAIHSFLKGNDCVYLYLEQMSDKKLEDIGKFLDNLATS